MDIEKLTKDFAKTKYAHGGYPLFAVTTDGGILCHDCVRDNYRIIRESQRENSRDGWQISAIDINYESVDLYCDNCNTQVESAYCN